MQHQPSPRQGAKLFLPIIAFTSLIAGIFFLIASLFDAGLAARAEVRVGCLAFATGAGLLIYLANIGVVRLPPGYSRKR